MQDESIGERIRRFRGKALTQSQLAERAGVGVSIIRKLEQGSRQGAAIATLQKIAKALDVDIADLVGRRYGVPSDDPEAGVVAIRRALTSVDDLLDATDDGKIVTLPEAKRAVDYAWSAYWCGRYELLAAVLPPGISQLRATAHAVQQPQTAPAHELLARMYWVAGCTLVHFGQEDPAYIAIRHALDAAERGSDPLLTAVLRGSVSWQLLVAGRYEEARGVALKAAASIEPSGPATDSHLSVYGSLMLSAGVATGRGQNVRDALHLADAAGEVAARITGVGDDYECNFNASQCVMQGVDIRVSSEQYPEALKAAQAMPANGVGLTPVARARHLLDQSVAWARTGRSQEALDALLMAERVGGEEWAMRQPLMKQVVGELLDHDRQSPLRELAQRVGVHA